MPSDCVCILLDCLALISCGLAGPLPLPHKSSVYDDDDDVDNYDDGGGALVSKTVQSSEGSQRFGGI